MISQKLTFSDCLALPLLPETAKSKPLIERLSYDQLMAYSDPKRITRASTVRVPPLKFDAYKDQEAYYFNVKSSPSTTGLRHKGYVRVFKPKNPNTPLEKCECEVDCSCPDYRFRWAWANKQKGSGKVGPGSVNQAWNKAPRIKNPRGIPGLCKHIIATRDFIYGQFHSFSGNQERTPSTTDKLDRLVKQSEKRWADHPGAVAKARERDQKIRQGIERAAYLRANPSAIPKISPSSLSAQPPAAKIIGARAAGVDPAAAGSNVAAAAAGDEPVAAWRARRSEESLVVTGMTNALQRDLDLLIEEQSALERSMAAGKSAPSDEGSEVMKLLREIRDLVRHIAGDDLPPDMAHEDEPPEEPGIPVDAAEARDQN